MCYGQILDHCIGPVPAQTEILSFATSRIRVARYLNHVTPGTQGFLGERVELQFGIR